MVTDCTANQNADCAANTDGNTVCVSNVCTGKCFKSSTQKREVADYMH